MLFRSVNMATTAPFLIAALLSVAFVLVILGRPDFVSAQQARHPQAAAKDSDQATLIARGKYIVEGVAGCGYCHTPRDQDGNPDHSRWLEGAPVFYEPARPMQGWANTVPRLAGLPPGSDADLIKLLTTSGRTYWQAPSLANASILYDPHRCRGSWLTSNPLTSNGEICRFVKSNRDQ